ncbi:MAG: polysaccharide biosynthesis protein [Acidobacteria bacterium]|nr:MAG: polysaccharide biosynthesis protein [Acidobacteriota bacterium]
MITSPKLRTNVSWTFTGNVIAALCNWLMVVALAKLGTSEIVGRFVLGLAITSPVILFSKLQLQAIQATDAQHNYLFCDYFGLRLVTLCFALLIIVGIAFFRGHDLNLALTIAIIGFGKAIDAVSDVIYGQLQQQEQMDPISKSLMMKGVFSLVLLALAQYLTQNVFWAAVGWSLGSTIVLLFYDLPNGATILKRHSYSGDSLIPRFNFQTLKRLTRLALPLGITMLFISLNINVPRYFVAHYAGEQSLGIFAALAAVATAGTYVTSALGQSAAPRLATYWTKDELLAFWKLLSKLMAIAVLLGVTGVLISWIAGKALLNFFYQSEYGMHPELLIWLMIGAGISYLASFFGYAATAAHAFKLQPLILGMCSAVTIGLCALLVPPYGILGAAWAILFANIVQLIFMGVYLAQSARRGQESEMLDQQSL